MMGADADWKRERTKAFSVPSNRWSVYSGRGDTRRYFAAGAGLPGPRFNSRRGESMRYFSCASHRDLTDSQHPRGSRLVSSTFRRTRMSSRAPDPARLGGGNGFGGDL
jgi:hypothetical protein